MSGRPAVFVDRDGVVNALVPDPVSGAPESPLTAGDVRLLDGAADALRLLRDAGYALVGASNQPAAAKGKTTRESLEAVQARVIELLAERGAEFDDFRICWHHESAADPALRGPCPCRKPAPGMLLDAAAHLGLELARSWMVGDTDADVLAGTAAGVRTVLIEHPPSAFKRTAGAEPTARAADLGAAARLIAGRDR
ncbi:MAG TPA: HAD family hydrolase [Solirubrobacteraceae bacterium]|nr:HAD family hydrolase [Solirubrobacteraceae bacterium]